MPRTSTPNSCASLPLNTVRATPFIPGRRSSRGKISGPIGFAGATGFCATARLARRKSNKAPKTGANLFMVVTINFVLEAGQDKMDGSLPKEILQLQGFILAGGQSRRMGRDKAHLLIENETFVDRIAATLEEVANSITLVGARQSHPRFSSAPDVYPGWGALGGLHAALAACASKWAIVVACDLPFVTAGLFKHLASLRTDHDAVVPLQSDGRPQPLAALYRIEPCLARATQL